MLAAKAPSLQEARGRPRTWPTVLDLVRYDRGSWQVSRRGRLARRTTRSTGGTAGRRINTSRPRRTTRSGPRTQGGTLWTSGRTATGDSARPAARIRHSARRSGMAAPPIPPAPRATCRRGQRPGQQVRGLAHPHLAGGSGSSTQSHWVSSPGGCPRGQLLSEPIAVRAKRAAHTNPSRIIHDRLSPPGPSRQEKRPSTTPDYVTPPGSKPTATSNHPPGISSPHNPAQRIVSLRGSPLERSRRARTAR